jgi:hypothetical protein
MTDPTSPTESSLKGTLTAHYRGEIGRLRQRPDLADSARTELDALDQGFADGFTDALCDRFESVVRAIASQSTLSYLTATPTGEQLAHASADRLRRDEQVVAHLTAELKSSPSAQRPAAAAALRDALTSHRNSWQLAAEKRAVPEASLAPAQALLRGLEAGVEALIAPQPAGAQPEPAAPQRSREIDVARILSRIGGPERAHSDDLRGELVLEDIADDGTVRELLRARVDQARAVAPTGAPTPRLAAADQVLSLAARSLGAAWTGAGMAAQAAAASKPADVVGLATLRAEIYRQRVQSATQVQGAARAAMERRHAALVAEAEHARQRAETDARFSADEVARARTQVAAELSAADDGRVPSSILATLRARTHAAVDPGPILPQGPGVAEAESALQYALASAAPEGIDLQAQVTQGAAEHQRATMGVLAERLLRRQASTSFASLPDFGAARVYAADRGAMDPLPQDDSMWGGVHERRLSRDAHEPTAPIPPRIASLGRAIASSIERLVGPPARRAGPVANPDATAQVMPRMAARMPSNIFADTSSMRMQSLYMPVLARMVGRPTPMLARPRARRKDNAGALLDSVGTPEGLYSLLLGELGDRLYEEKPDVAQRLEASLKRAAAALPTAGDQAMPVLQRHTEQFRTTVETWLGAGSQEGVERGRTEEVLSAGQGAARTIGDYVGGMFAIDQHGAGASEIDLLQERTNEVESQLRAERTFVDQGLLDRVSGMVGRGPTRAVEAYQGPMAQAIAQEMGAEAFTVENKMFFPHAVPESIKAHEMVHAIDASSDAHPRTIEDEERLAYGVQGKFEQGRKAIDIELNNAANRMELAKEQNIPAAKLTTDPGGVAGTEQPDPGVRTSNPKDQMFKEEQLMEAVTDAVESMIVFEEDIDRERYGRT